MEGNIIEVSFHQVQTAHVEIMFTPILAAVSYLVHEWLTIHKISNLLFYYKSNQQMHTILSKSQYNYHTPSATYFMAHHKGAHNCTKQLTYSSRSGADFSSHLTLHYVTTDGTTS